MAKVQIKSEKLTPFGGIFSIMEQFDSMLSPIIDQTLGQRCRSIIGYQYSEIIRSLMSVYFCGGSCVEDVTSHLMRHLSYHPTLRTCSSDTILRAIKELTQENISYGYLNHSFQNAVFEGIRMSCQSGLHGWEVTDLKVTFTQAEYYSPVSTPADFRQLTPYVFRLALQQSGVDILEPMLCFELQIPQVASSKAITDLQKMMSEIEDISCNNEWCHIKGKVPLNTSKDYASEVSSYTKGSVSYTHLTLPTSARV